jgi:hypothetical protein
LRYGKAGRGAEKKMTLKIQRTMDGEVVVYTLSGRIEAEQLAELQRLVQSETDDLGMLIDLKEVKLVDRDAVVCLEDWEAGGMRLENCPAYIREWITAERNQRGRQEQS